MVRPVVFFYFALFLKHIYEDLNLVCGLAEVRSKPELACVCGTDCSQCDYPAMHF